MISQIDKGGRLLNVVKVGPRKYEILSTVTQNCQKKIMSRGALNLVSAQTVHELLKGIPFFARGTQKFAKFFVPPSFLSFAVDEWEVSFSTSRGDALSPDKNETRKPGHQLRFVEGWILEALGSNG